MKRKYYVELTVDDEEGALDSSEMATWICGAMGRNSVGKIDATVYATLADIVSVSKHWTVDSCPMCGGRLSISCNIDKDKVVRVSCAVCWGLYDVTELGLLTVMDDRGDG